MFPVTLTDGVVPLRPLRADDVVSMFEAICESLSDLKPRMSWAHDNYERKETRDWITVAQVRWMVDILVSRSSMPTGILFSAGAV